MRRNVLRLLLLAACTSTSDVGDEVEVVRASFTSDQAILLDFEADGQLVADTNDAGAIRALVEAQLLFTVGQLNGDRSVGQMGSRSLRDPRDVDSQYAALCRELPRASSGRVGRRHEADELHVHASCACLTRCSGGFCVEVRRELRRAFALRRRCRLHVPCVPPALQLATHANRTTGHCLGTWRTSFAGSTPP